MIPNKNLHLFDFRFLLKTFVEARCLDWVIVIGIILFDSVSLTDIVAKVDSFKDVTKDRLQIMISNLNDVNLWLETKWFVFHSISAINLSDDRIHRIPRAKPNSIWW